MDASSLLSKAGNSVNIAYTSIPKGVTNVDQGYYNNKGTSAVSQVPAIDLAYLSNVTVSPDPDAIIVLNPICLTFCDFLILFFRSPSLVFYISPSNDTSSAITFNDQVYESTQSKCVQFALYYQIKKAWAKKNNKSEALIPANISIQASRAGFLTKSLGSFTEVVMGLSFDEVISALIENKQIQVGDFEDKATVKFIVTVNEYFAPLETTLQVQFVYVVQIPCFKNINECDGFCNYYSNERTECRKCFEDSDLNFENLQVLGTATKAADPVVDLNANAQDDDSFVFSEISKLIKEDDTIGSSLW